MVVQELKVEHLTLPQAVVVVLALLVAMQPQELVVTVVMEQQTQSLEHL
jgi:hypothetical protein